MPPTGGTHSEETKRKIGATQARRHAYDMEPPERRRCPKCGELKRSVEFYWRTRTLKSGVRRVEPYGRCKPCQAAHRAEWWERKTAGEQAVRRERFNWQRRERRAGRYPLVGPKRPQSDRLDTAPLLEYLEDKDTETMERDYPTETRYLRDARRTGEVTRNQADRILIAMGAPHMLVLLYGD